MRAPLRLISSTCTRGGIELEEPREGLIIYRHEIKKSHESPGEIERFCVQSQASGPQGLIDMVEVTACGRCQVFSGKGWSYLGFESFTSVDSSCYNVR